MKFLQQNLFYRYKVHIISGTAFLVWIVFFDRSNLINQFKMHLEYRDIVAQKQLFDDELEKIKKEEKLVFEDMKSVESFAREKYMMKKEGETVFVMVDEDDKPIKE